MAEGLGAWKSFDDMEDNLVLDELLLLQESVGKKHSMMFRMMAAVQGIELKDDEDNGLSRKLSDDELPPELLAREQEWKRQKEEHIKNGEKARSELESVGLGYSVK